jgi:hypothetical protein
LHIPPRRVGQLALRSACVPMSWQPLSWETRLREPYRHSSAKCNCDCGTQSIDADALKPEWLHFGRPVRSLAVR